MKLNVLSDQKKKVFVFHEFFTFSYIISLWNIFCELKNKIIINCKRIYFFCSLSMFHKPNWVDEQSSFFWKTKQEIMIQKRRRISKKRLKKQKKRRKNKNVALYIYNFKIWNLLSFLIFLAHQFLSWKN